MANTPTAPTTTSIKTTSHDTALCVIPPHDLCGNIDQLRELYDKAYNVWPPHVNLVYPFVAPENLPRAQEQIKAYLDEHLDLDSSGMVSLDDTGLFAQRSNSTIFLRESQEPADSIMTKLQSLSMQALGQKPTTSNLHLTVGQSEDNTLSSREYLMSKARLLPTLKFSIGALAILVRERVPNAKAPQPMRLWGLVPLAQSPKDIWMPSEFWIPGNTELLDPESEEQDERKASHKEPATVAREVQSGVTYQYDTQRNAWVCCNGAETHSEVTTSMTVASYNVLIDSEYPPARERDPLVVQTILADTAASDILVLQEVSDDFLSYMLNDSEIRRLYPFTSHAPPSQPDVGPLPSLRNIIVLSRWPFDWKFVPFHRRHKGAVVATFNGIMPGQSSGQGRIVVAGVHLTCGLTDGSVAAKKIQMDNLTRYLQRNHKTEPWIIAGDFNIPTSTYTINTALKSKSISNQTVATLASIESDFTNLGLLDAWAVARLRAADEIDEYSIGTQDHFSSSNNVNEDLFEGEEGGTFNPGDNPLAAATSGTSNGRPQRYDRVLVRPQDLLHVTRFGYFGLPQHVDGVQVVPSDHLGIRTMLRIDNAEQAQKHANIVQQMPVEYIRAIEALSVSQNLSSTLAAHAMLPSHEEILHRQRAFDLLKQVVLGAHNVNDSSMSSIPLVVVPVGSYALGVWTAASDIDCLCIGTISSKTFFKLVRQRILKAEPEGVRILRKVEANTGTMLELSVNGVSMDLQYCPAARVVERWSDFHQLQTSDPIFNLSVLSLRKLKPYRDLLHIQRTLPSMLAFRLAYRCIKLWALQRGVYAAKFGYLGGIHITLMLTWICKRIAHDNNSVSAADLVVSFFHYYSHFDWANNMVYDAFFHDKKPRYHRTAREPMVVLGYHTPNSNIAHTSTIPGLQVLVQEFKAASDRLSNQSMTWDTFFGLPTNDASSTGMSNGVRDFLNKYESYVKVDIQFWGRTLAKGKGLLGWVESRCLSLVVDMHKVLPNLGIRLWPARFTDSDSEDTKDYQGCYIIGVSHFSGDVSGSGVDGVDALKQSLEKVFDRFLNQLKAEEKNYDANTSWVGISLANTDDLKDHGLDEREWGGYSAEIEPDSDDEEELADELEDIATKPTQRTIPQRPKPTSQPLSTSKLRPASDVLNRLRWDPNLDPAEYIIGYEDRFLGARETSLEKWKTEQTDEEFIPQHRILYFKKRVLGDRVGEVVWKRATRIDRVFGSGVGAGAEAQETTTVA